MEQKLNKRNQCENKFCDEWLIAPVTKSQAKQVTKSTRISPHEKLRKTKLELLANARSKSSVNEDTLACAFQLLTLPGYPHTNRIPKVSVFI